MWSATNADVSNWPALYKSFVTTDLVIRCHFIPAKQNMQNMYRRVLEPLLQRIPRKKAVFGIAVFLRERSINVERLMGRL
jgi:hypothetical protein